MLDDPREAATAGPDSRAATAGQAMLKVVANGAVSTFPLPASGELVIGRSNEADISIDDASISRRHARLELGPAMRVTDLGSANGTFIGGRRLEPNEPIAIFAGEVVDLGSVMVIVQARFPGERPRRVWAHGDFEAKLDEECTRAGATGSFAVVRIRVDEPPPAAELEPLLLGSLRAADSLAAYVPGEYHALLLDVAAADAPALGKALLANLRAHGVTARLGLACYSASGTTAAALIAAAGAKLPRESGVVASRDAFVPSSGAAMAQVYRVIDRVAVGDIGVLLLGETGVGKEVLAEAVHRRSPRRDKPLLRLNCAALTETLFESELFGHEKGAFTGAAGAKPGLLESADGGTVFLDEVGELPMTAQVKLLRVIEDHKVTRVGGLRPHEIDVRFVAATNRDLEAEVARGTFRQDLYFRLDGISVVIPPLRERVDEIEPLARAFIAAVGRGREVTLAPEAAHALRNYGWPGNIRELRNVIERAVLLCDDEIQLEHLPMEKIASTLRVPSSAPVGADSLSAALAPLDKAYDLAERARILDALDACGGNQSRAAKQLGISRGTLVTRLAAYGIPRPRKK